VDEPITSLPTSYVIRRVGAAPKKLALTFDDGPDPEWTQAILESSKRKGDGDFFHDRFGDGSPSWLWCSRCWRTGMRSGNHTLYHPDLSDTPEAAVRLELNATQRCSRL